MEIEPAIAKVREGDTAAYGVVVHEFQGRLRAFIASWCPDMEQVDEIAQRVFVWAYEHIREYEPGTRFYAWLKAIARNTLLSELEVQKREAEGRRKYLNHLMVRHSREELESAASEEASDASDLLRGCLDELPEKSRKLVRRRYEGMEPVRDIAREEGKKESAVKVALFRIRQVLKRCVEGKMAARPAPQGT